jgi:hypothetical protein
MMVQQNEFMLLFRFQPDMSTQPTEAELNEMHQQWGAFIGNIAIREKLVNTYQLGFEGVQISADQTDQEGILVAAGQTVAGTMVVRAHSLTEATDLAKDCPILLMGGTVEVRSIQPM